MWLLDRPFTPVLGVPMLGLVLVAQGLRWWAVAALGRRWNVRTIVVPGLSAVREGPYRFVRHPNYVAVVLEGIAVPLVHGGVADSRGLHAPRHPSSGGPHPLRGAALAEHCDYARLKDVPRFVPRPR